MADELAAMEAEQREENKAILTVFYNKFDPGRVKNVDGLFYGFDFFDIKAAIKKKYGGLPKDWGGDLDLPSQRPGSMAYEKRKTLVEKEAIKKKRNTEAAVKIAKSEAESTTPKKKKKRDLNKVKNRQSAKDPALKKYRDMLKTGTKAAVIDAMTADGVDPKLMFGKEAEEESKKVKEEPKKEEATKEEPKKEEPKKEEPKKEEPKKEEPKKEEKKVEEPKVEEEEAKKAEEEAKKAEEETKQAEEAKKKAEPAVKTTMNIEVVVEESDTVAPLPKKKDEPKKGGFLRRLSRAGRKSAVEKKKEASSSSPGSPAKKPARKQSIMSKAVGKLTTPSFLNKKKEEPKKGVPQKKAKIPKPDNLRTDLGMMEEMKLKQYLKVHGQYPEWALVHEKKEEDKPKHVRPKKAKEPDNLRKDLSMMDQIKLKGELKTSGGVYPAWALVQDKPAGGKPVGGKPAGGAGRTNKKPAAPANLRKDLSMMESIKLQGELKESGGVYPAWALTVEKKAKPAGGGSKPAKKWGAPAGGGGGGKAPNATEMQKYIKMKKICLPQGAVDNCMVKDGFDPKTFTTTPGAGGGKGKTPNAQEMQKYIKMRKKGLPQGAVDNCMTRDGFDPSTFSNTPASSGPPGAPSAGPPPGGPPDRAGPGPPPGGPNPWTKVLDRASNAYYYHNKNTGATQWNDPGTGLGGAPPPPLPATRAKTARAIYAFTPQGNPLEMPLTVGDIVEVTEEGADGVVEGQEPENQPGGLVP